MKDIPHHSWARFSTWLLAQDTKHIRYSANEVRPTVAEDGAGGHIVDYEYLVYEAFSADPK